MPAYGQRIESDNCDLINYDFAASLIAIQVHVSDNRLFPSLDLSHRGPEMWWSNNATIEDWFDEMVGQANIINRFANIRMEEIRGI